MRWLVLGVDIRFLTPLLCLMRLFSTAAGGCCMNMSWEPWSSTADSGPGVRNRRDVLTTGNRLTFP